MVLSPLGLPCNPPPWGLLHAIDMRDGHQLWAVPLGTTAGPRARSRSSCCTGPARPTSAARSSPAAGLVFIGAALDNYLRAFDAASGKELWRGRLPAGGQATPMTYVWKGRQYVVIAAGGHAKSGTKRGDQVVAFAPACARTPFAGPGRSVSRAAVIASSSASSEADPRKRPSPVALNQLSSSSLW